MLASVAGWIDDPSIHDRHRRPAPSSRLEIPVRPFTVPEMPASTLQDVLDILEEYRVRVDRGRSADATWLRRKTETFERVATRFG